MIRIAAPQQMAVMPSAARVVPVLGDLSPMWFGVQVDPCIGANHGSTGFTAKRSTRHLRRPSA
jgi:hypothetical protein